MYVAFAILMVLQLVCLVGLWSLRRDHTQLFEHSDALTEQSDALCEVVARLADGGEERESFIALLKSFVTGNDGDDQEVSH